MPASMPLYADAVGFVPVAADSAPGRKIYQWQYVGGDNARIEADSVSYLDYGKRLAVSTFADYAAFARAYDARSRDKGRVALAVKRQLRFSHDGQVCTPAEHRRMQPLVERMQRDLKSQLIVTAR